MPLRYGPCFQLKLRGAGSSPINAPKILFERHIFSRLTNGQYDAHEPDISAPTQGGYGPGGANQYIRLQAAMQLNGEAALKSASWGIGQLMGENYAFAGFPDVDTMIAAIVGSEDGQLSAMASFIRSNGMNTNLQNHDWPGFARLCNGPDYASNNYDELLQQFYQRYAVGPIPDLDVRAVQILLTYQGFSLGVIDGINGTGTQAAIKAFQTSKGLAPTGNIDDQLIIELEM